jgi:hypothetical protein
MSATKLIDIQMNYQSQQLTNIGQAGNIYNYNSSPNPIVLDSQGTPILNLNNNTDRPLFGIAKQGETLNSGILPLYALGTKNFTLSFEIKLDSMHQSTLGCLFGIIESSGGNEFRLGIDQGKFWNFMSTGFSNLVFTINLTKVNPFNSFNKYVLVRDGTQARMYVNRELHDTISCGNFSFNNYLMRDGWDIQLFGRRAANTSAGLRQIVGQLKSFKLYDGICEEEFAFQGSKLFSILNLVNR